MSGGGVEGFRQANLGARGFTNMKFSCDRCDAQYMISDEKVGPKGVRVRCKSAATSSRSGGGDPRTARRGAEQPPARSSPAPVAGGLDAELGQAFDHAFGGSSASTPARARSSPCRRRRGTTPTPTRSRWRWTTRRPPRPRPRPPGPRRPPRRPPRPSGTSPSARPRLARSRSRRSGASGRGPTSALTRWCGARAWATGRRCRASRDLAAYLRRSRPRRGRADAAPASSALRTDRSPTPAPTPAPGDVSWKPVGASALAALASEEIAPDHARAAGRGRSAAGGAGIDGSASVRDAGRADGPAGRWRRRPDRRGPAADEGARATGEHKMERISSVARGAEELRQRRSASRGIRDWSRRRSSCWAAARRRTGTPAGRPRPRPSPRGRSVAAAAPLPPGAGARTRPGPARARGGSSLSGPPKPPPRRSPPTPRPLHAEPAPAEPVKADPVAAAPEVPSSAAASRPGTRSRAGQGCGAGSQGRWRATAAETPRPR